jgi:hypothetical protein
MLHLQKMMRKKSVWCIPTHSQLMWHLLNLPRVWQFAMSQIKYLDRVVDTIRRWFCDIQIMWILIEASNFEWEKIPNHCDGIFAKLYVFPDVLQSFTANEDEHGEFCTIILLKIKKYSIFACFWKLLSCRININTNRLQV